MTANSAVQNTWLKLLHQAMQPGEVHVERLGEGYYAVVAAKGNESTDGFDECVCQRSLATRIPHLERTRAVSISAESTYDLPGTETLGAWAGEAAAAVSSGARQAYAVVDIETLARQLSAEFAAMGWAVARTGDELRLSDGRFTEPVNVLRAAVRMVLSRSAVPEAARGLAEEIRNELARAADFFGRFAARFALHGPAVLDHYFVVNPEASCAAVGWDYWQLNGQAAAEEEMVFAQEMQEFENFLRSAGQDWQPASSARVCDVNHSQH